MNGTSNSSDLVRIELHKKKDSTIPLILGTVLTVILFLVFGWIAALIAFIITIGFSIKTHRVSCPRCNHKNSVHNNSYNMTCVKCKSLTLIDWK